MHTRIETDAAYFAALERIQQLEATDDLENETELELLACLVEDYEERNPHVVIDPEACRRQPVA
jgi:hypothetical protein